MDGPSTDHYQPTPTPLADTKTKHPANRDDDQLQRQTAEGVKAEGSPLLLRTVQGINLSDNARHKIDSLFTIINERLGMMSEMAKLKIRLGEQVLDQSREQLVMDKALEYAGHIKLDSELAQRFIRGQMEVAKFLQNQEQKASPLDVAQAALRKQALREKLINITPKMLNALKEIADDLELVAFRNAIQTTLSHQMKGLPLEIEDLQEIVFRSLYP